MLAWANEEHVWLVSTTRVAYCPMAKWSLSSRYSNTISFLKKPLPRLKYCLAIKGVFRATSHEATKYRNDWWFIRGHSSIEAEMLTSLQKQLLQSLTFVVITSQFRRRQMPPRICGLIQLNRTGSQYIRGQSLASGRHHPWVGFKPIVDCCSHSKILMTSNGWNGVSRKWTSRHWTCCRPGISCTKPACDV